MLPNEMSILSVKEIPEKKAIAYQDFNCLQTLTGHSGSVYAVTLTPDNQQIVSWSLDKTLKIWNLATGNCLRTQAGFSSVNSFSITPNGKTLISASWDETLTLWELATGKCLQRLATWTGEDAFASSMVITADGKKIIVSVMNYSRSFYGHV